MNGQRECKLDIYNLAWYLVAWTYTSSSLYLLDGGLRIIQLLPRRHPIRAACYNIVWRVYSGQLVIMSGIGKLLGGQEDSKLEQKWSLFDIYRQCSRTLAPIEVAMAGSSPLMPGLWFLLKMASLRAVLAEICPGRFRREIDSPPPCRRSAGYPRPKIWQDTLLMMPLHESDHSWAGRRPLNFDPVTATPTACARARTVLYLSL